MANHRAGTVELIIRELGEALQTIDQFSLETIPSLGLRLPPALANHPDLLDTFTNLGAVAGNLGEAITSLSDAIAAENATEIVSAGQSLVSLVADLIRLIDDLADQLDNLAVSLGSLTPAEVAEVQNFAALLPARMLDYLLIQYLESLSPTTVEVLNLTGLLEKRLEPGVPGDVLQPPYLRRTLHIGRLSDLFQDPAQYLEDLYGWGSPTFDAGTLFTILQDLIETMDLPADIFETGGTPTLEAYAFSLTPNTTTSLPSLDLKLRFPANEDLEVDLPAVSIWTTRLTVSARFEAGIDGQLSPPLSLSLNIPSPTAGLDLTLGIVGQDPEGPIIVFGSTDGSRAEAQKLFVDIGFSAAISGDGLSAAEPKLGAGLEGGKIVIDLSSGDGFVSEVASGQGIEGNFDLKALWQPSEGLAFEGSGGVEISIPTHIELGPIKLNNIYIILSFAADPPLKLETSVALAADFGPLKASVDRIGAEARLRFPGNNDGNLGPLDLALAFKPPTGVGLAIDAGVVKGGGYLYFDTEKEEYAGALELAFAEFLTLKAIGLITTRMPDGSKGFSLLIIITAEFGSPIQLGFGFTLIGVGGLLGLNRTMRLELIATGVRTGAMNSIMFPRDVIENAPRIISDLREFFPPEVGIFLIGPMAKLGWGTPTLVSISLGIIIEIPPGNIVILGVLKVVLPDEDAALIILQVNFIGALEVDKKRLWFFAAIFESRIVFLTIEGEMGLLFAWGADGNFVLSVGGFHPSFSPPPMPFPSPKRVAVSILNEEYAKVRVEGYFAVTSNTVQFGARAEIFFGLSEFKIEGHLAFDALFQFSPFYFIISLSVSLGVKVFGVGLFSVRMRGELEGTSPWHIEGEGSISLLFFSIDVPFSHTWGQEEDTTLPPIAVMPLLEAEFNKLENWTAEPPSSKNVLVSLRKIESTEDLVLHPVGVLRVTQRAVPLDLDLDKVGNQKPSDVRKIIVDVPEGDLQKHGDTREQFAIAQFKDLSDSAKLSSKAYEYQIAGVEISAGSDQADGLQSNSDAAVKRVVRYEEIIIDNNFKGHLKRFVGYAAELFFHFLNGNAAAKSNLSANYKKQKIPFDQYVAVDQPVFVVAKNSDNSAFSDEAHFTSQAKANDFMREQINKDPSNAGLLHVIPATEMSEAV